MKPGLDLWMETRIRKDPSLTPARVAYQCRYYMKLNMGIGLYSWPVGKKGQNKGDDEEAEAANAVGRVDGFREFWKA